jgi:ABC-type polysaccharide/polyol phosphate transport system ATPase subunit
MPTRAAQISAVAVEGLSKNFRLPHERVHTIKERALHPFRRHRYDRLEALREVTFDVRGGEFFGITGRNGCGKSTLLKCVAGIYKTDAGRIILRGRMAPFIELGVGFNLDLTARDNVMINAIMLGLTPAEARARYDAVIDFAELHDFEDLKLKNYSSGMHVRLAFAVMVQVDADILLIDEVLAVGDASFQHKCHEQLGRMRRQGRTILFVTHDMTTIERSCDRAMLLEQGRLVEMGEPRRIARMYDELNFRRQSAGVRDDERRYGDGSAAIIDAWFEDGAGRRVHALDQGSRCSFHALVEMLRAAKDPMFGFALGNEQNRKLFATATPVMGEPTGEFSAGQRVRLSVHFENLLAPGSYSASPVVTHADARLMDLREDLVSIAVLGERTTAGIVDLPHEVSVRRTDATRGPDVVLTDLATERWE